MDEGIRLLESDAELPQEELGRLYGLASAGMDNVRAIDLRQGSGFAVPAIRARAAELRRIARGYALIRKPFADCNDLLGRSYQWSRNFFRMRIDQLAAHGLELVRMWSAKPTFA